MKMKNVSLTFVVALILFVMGVGSSFAFDASARDNSSRVTVAANHQGDVLLGSLYNALGEYETKITIVNTSETLPVVAKVVFRSAAISAETLDFFIYLTPSDVWDATITLSDDGKNAMITSTDDSVKANTTDWASEKTPMVAVFKTDKLGMGGTAVDTNTFGHFEVIGYAAYRAGLTLAQLPLSKGTLYNNYHFLNATTNPTWATQFTDVPNVLIGNTVMFNGVYGQHVKQNLTALKNWESLVGNTGNGRQETLAINTGLYTSNSNSAAEIDAALAKTEFSLPYDLRDNGGDSEILFVTTFPTKYFARENAFFTGYNGCLAVTDDIDFATYKVWDMMEKKYQGRLSGGINNLCSEVNFVFLRTLITQPLAEGFVKGWIKTTYFNGTTNNFSKNGTAISYDGVPMLSSYITISEDGDMNWTDSASPESNVSYGAGNNLVRVRSNSN